MGNCMTRILISGAGVAGATLAHCLRQRGFEPLIVERSPTWRSGGQAIDVRGAALEVLRHMGLESAAREKRTTMRGMYMLDGNGNELWRSEESTLSAGRIDSEDIELLRDDLVHLMSSAIGDVEYLFGNSIRSLEQSPQGVTVDFTNAATQEFDLVIGADGLHSITRELAFGPESECITHLGTYLSVFSSDNFLELDNWQSWFNDGDLGGAVFAVRDNAELRVNLGFHSKPFDFDPRDTAAHKRLLREKFADFGWEVPTLLDRMDTAADFYFDSMAQVHLPSWSQGRVALVGDAAYCCSPLSGQGTSAAIVGAFVLASELRRANGDHQTAFARYEDRVRPFVVANQALATEERDRYSEAENLAAMDKAKNAIDLSDQRK